MPEGKDKLNKQIFPLKHCASCEAAPTSSAVSPNQIVSNQTYQIKLGNFILFVLLSMELMRNFWWTDATSQNTAIRAFLCL